MSILGGYVWKLLKLSHDVTRKFHFFSFLGPKVFIKKLSERNLQIEINWQFRSFVKILFFMLDTKIKDEVVLISQGKNAPLVLQKNVFVWVRNFIERFSPKNIKINLFWKFVKSVELRQPREATSFPPMNMAFFCFWENPAKT